LARREFAETTLKEERSKERAAVARAIWPTPTARQVKRIIKRRCVFKRVLQRRGLSGNMIETFRAQRLAVP
jgi:hypothetical protein